MLFSCWSVACQAPGSERSESAVASDSTATVVTAVTTATLTPQTFRKELISQGTIRARYRIDVSFDLNERIEAVLIETGQRVNKGAILARLNDFEWRNQLQKIDHQIEQAKIQLEAKLISLGYSGQDSLNIPPAILKTARLESNLDGLEIERAMAKYKLEQTLIKAPISGIVAEVEAQAGTSSSASSKLCTIIDDRHLDAIFPVLEQELTLVRKGQRVSIEPLHKAGKRYPAKIRTYQPQVDQQGMVQVFARLPQPEAALLDGMHVTVYIEEAVSAQLVVPKSAVVDRQGRQVVFVHKDGQALWNYVQIGLENSDAYTIAEGLEAGDEVIISNNFHLAHLETVQVQQ